MGVEVAISLRALDFKAVLPSSGRAAETSGNLPRHRGAKEFRRSAGRGNIGVLGRAEPGAARQLSNSYRLRGPAEDATMSKQPPADHLEYLRRRPFVFGCETAVFPPEELELLEERGNWLEALAAGKIRPVTAEQEHFLRVDRDEAEPRTLAERAWLRLKGRREFEQANRKAAPPEPQPDYGMVEFDADRCWW
jgi:uncharacterized protein YifE (UPF0438 family)